MATYREGGVGDQGLLFSFGVGDWVPRSEFVRSLKAVVDRLDLRVLAQPGGGPGAPAYNPAVLFRVLVFAYSQGVRSSRVIAEALRYDVRYMWLADRLTPDHVTLCRFRRRHGAAFVSLFAETVRECQRQGLVGMGLVASDGTKLRANVSGKETYSRKRLDQEEEALRTALARVMDEADEADADVSDEAPDPGDGEASSRLVRRQERLRRAREAMDQTNRTTVAATDPDSHVMRMGSTPLPAYNAEAAVDSECQVIVAALVTSDENDYAMLAPVMNEVHRNAGRMPDVTVADSGFGSPRGLAWADRHLRCALIPPPAAQTQTRQQYTFNAERDVYVGENGRELRFWRVRQMRAGGTLYRVYRAKGMPKEEHWVPVDDRLNREMRARLAAPEGKRLYRLRQQIVEPVFGQIKTRGLRRLLLRGLQGATVEWMLACIAHNIRKVWRYGNPQAQAA